MKVIAKHSSKGLLQSSHTLIQRKTSICHKPLLLTFDIRKKKDKVHLNLKTSVLFYTVVPIMKECLESEKRHSKVWRLHIMQQLIVCVVVTRIWTLGLCSEALVGAVILLIPPGPLVSPACETSTNQKVLLHFSRCLFTPKKVWL